MAETLNGPVVVLGFVDKRRAKTTGGDDETYITTPITMFTANAGGTTTTLVGAVSVPNTGVNVARVGERFRLFTAAGVLKEEKVFTVTAIGATGTPVTFTPAAAVATVSTDVAKLLDSDAYADNATLDAALFALNPTTYTAARLRQMTQNDKIYALRVDTDRDGI